MFSILQKQPDSVNAEDLETLQNDIEKCLVKVVTQKWELERELLILNSTSPDIANNTANNSNQTSTANDKNSNTVLNSATTSNGQGGKLRTSHRLSLNDSVELSTDGFKSSVYISTNSTNGVAGSGNNSNEDSASSEGTSSTIITSTSAVKRSHKASGLTGSLALNERPSKRFRQGHISSTATANIQTKRPPHCKHKSKYKNPLEESRPNKKQFPRNEAPDKLWPFVEQFCSTPTQKQILDLEEMITAMENDKEYFKIPALGTKKDSPTKLDNNSSAKNQKCSNSLGALTQRVVSSFIEESDVEVTGQESSNKKKNSKSNNKGNVDMNSAGNLEKTIRQELEKHDILDPSDEIPYTSEEDEVLRELIACQHELSTIQRQNKVSMERLLEKAREHVKLEIERAKLREANADVIAAYQRLIQAKQRKRNPTKKEKDAAWKALKIQEAIYKKCDDLYLSTLDRSRNSG